jgi:hypothetical protein
MTLHGEGRCLCAFVDDTTLVVGCSGWAYMPDLRGLICSCAVAALLFTTIFKWYF